MKTLEQMKEWYISAVRSVLIINFGIMDDEADRAVSAYRLREKLDADPHGQLENNVEGVAEDIARREFIGRPSDLTYKGYVTSIRYDSYLKHLYGKIEGISEFISFEAEPGQDIEEEFHRAVDDYLAYCEDEGIEPDKSYTGVLNVRLTPSIHRQVAMLARQAGLSINAYIKDTLEKRIKTAAIL